MTDEHSTGDRFLSYRRKMALPDEYDPVRHADALAASGRCLYCGRPLVLHDTQTHYGLQTYTCASVPPGELRVGDEAFVALFRDQARALQHHALVHWYVWANRESYGDDPPLGVRAEAWATAVEDAGMADEVLIALTREASDATVRWWRPGLRSTARRLWLRARARARGRRRRPHRQPNSRGR